MLFQSVPPLLLDARQEGGTLGTPDDLARLAQTDHANLRDLDRALSNRHTLWDTKCSILRHPLFHLIFHLNRLKNDYLIRSQHLDRILPLTTAVARELIPAVKALESDLFETFS